MLNKLILLLSFATFLFSSIASASLSTRMQNAVEDVLVEFSQKNRWPEAEVDAAEVLYLEDFPKSVMGNFESDLYDRDEYGSVSDHNTLMYWVFEDEYGFKCRIVKSLELSVSSEKAYVAYYQCYGGEWAREIPMTMYFVLDSTGKIYMSDYETEDSIVYDADEFIHSVF